MQRCLGTATHAVYINDQYCRQEEMHNTKCLWILCLNTELCFNFFQFVSLCSHTLLHSLSLVVPTQVRQDLAQQFIEEDKLFLQEKMPSPHLGQYLRTQVLRHTASEQLAEKE